jgi:hypothetical protein
VEEQHASIPLRRVHAVEEQVLDDPAGQHSTTGLEPLTHYLQAEFVKTAERAQVRAREGSVRHVAPIGRHGGVSARIR